MNSLIGKNQKNHIKRFLVQIDRFGWAVLLILTPLFLFISPKTSWVLFLIPLLWSISFLSGNPPVSFTPYNPVLLLLALQILLSLYATYDIAISLPKIAGLLFSIVLFFYLLKLNIDKRGMLVSLVIFLSAGFGIAFLGMMGTDWSTSKIMIFNPIYELVPSITNFIPKGLNGFHPNEVAGTLIWVIPVWLCLLVWMYFGYKNLRSNLGAFRYFLLQIMLTLIILFICIVFLFTQSRSAYIGFAFSILLMLLIVLPKKYKFVLLFLFLLISLALIYMVSTGQFTEIINYIFPGSGLSTTAFSINTLSGRVEIWSRAIYAIQDFSFTGMGMNNFRNIVHVLYPLYTVSPDIPLKDIGHAHNEFLQTALDLGIPGLIAFIGIYFVSFWMLISSISRQKVALYHSKGRATKLHLSFWYFISIGLFGGQAAHFFFGITDAISLGAKPAVLFWIMQSLICSIYFKTHLQSSKTRKVTHPES